MKYTVSEFSETFAGLLRELGAALDELGVPWMLVGGLAVGAWTEPRGTKDCDLAIAVPEDPSALARRTRCVVLGVDLPIVQPDDLVIYKLIAGRPQDLADIDKLLRFGRAPSDAAHVRRWAREWGVEERWERAIADARRGTES